MLPKDSLAKVATQRAHGLSLRGEQSSVVSHSLFSSNSGGQAGSVYGISLYGVCLRCTVMNNEMLANYGAAMYGFKDFATNCTTLLRSNIAFGQGHVFLGGEGALVDSGTMNYMLTYGDVDQMNVQMIIKEGDIGNLNAFEAGTTNWYNFSILDRAISG